MSRHLFAACRRKKLAAPVPGRETACRVSAIASCAVLLVSLMSGFGDGSILVVRQIPIERANQRQLLQAQESGRPSVLTRPLRGCQSERGSYAHAAAVNHGSDGVRGIRGTDEEGRRDMGCAERECFTCNDHRSDVAGARSSLPERVTEPAGRSRATTPRLIGIGRRDTMFHVTQCDLPGGRPGEMCRTLPSFAENMT
jgi:hypothetical protein